MTSSASLRKAMAKEVSNIRENTEVVGGETWRRPERRVGFTTKALVALGIEGML